MGRLVFSDGGEYYRPGRPHVFDPGLRAAAHYLQAVEKVEPRVRRELDGVLDAHPFPSYFIEWQGLRLEPDELSLIDTPGLDSAVGEREFDRARPFLEAFRAWLTDHYMWSPVLLDLLYRTLALRHQAQAERRYHEETIKDWESDPEPMTDDEAHMLDATKTRVEFLTGELDGWGWWVDLLASDATIPDLGVWLNTKTARTGKHRRLFERMDRLPVEIEWEPPPSAPPFWLSSGGWRPEEETWKDFEARVREHFERALKDYRHRSQSRLKGGTLGPRPKDSKHGKWGEPQAWQAAPAKYGDDHFRWLALRQVKGLRPSEIAERRDVARTVSTVNEGIDSAASLLQLPLRPVRTGPQTVL